MVYSYRSEDDIGCL